MTERRDIIMRREFGRLYPVNDAETEILCEYPQNTDLWVSIRRKRSKVQNDFYWVKLDAIIASGATKYFSSTQLHEALKYEMGYVKAIRKLNGEIVYEPDSTAFDKMEQSEFNKYFEEAMRLVREHFGINPDDL